MNASVAVTFTVIGADVTIAPRLSVATAVSWYEPTGAPVQVTEYGAVLSMPRLVAPRKNCTCAMAPSATSRATRPIR